MRMTNSRLLKSRLNNISRLEKSKVSNPVILSRLNNLPDLQPANYDPAQDK
jgi:hypothetical protein